MGLPHHPVKNIMFHEINHPAFGKSSFMKTPPWQYIMEISLGYDFYEPY
jgi:hypothetical protein